MDQGLLGPPSGAPGRGLPGGLPGGAGKFPGNFRPRAGPPGGAPGTPILGPRGTPKMGPKMGPIWALINRIYGSDPPPGGPSLGVHFVPPGGGPPRGAKSAHFFGYLITLPVGTVWGLFFGPRDTPGLGQFGGYPWYHLRWAVFIHQLCCYGWAGALGRRASDGYPLAGLTANGWYVPSGRAPPSRQGRKSAQHREVAGRSQPFARAKRGWRLE